MARALMRVAIHGMGDRTVIALSITTFVLRFVSDLTKPYLVGGHVGAYVAPYAA